MQGGGEATTTLNNNQQLQNDNGNFKAEDVYILGETDTSAGGMSDEVGTLVVIIWKPSVEFFDARSLVPHYDLDFSIMTNF